MAEENKGKPQMAPEGAFVAGENLDAEVVKVKGGKVIIALNVPEGLTGDSRIGVVAVNDTIIPEEKKTVDEADTPEPTEEEKKATAEQIAKNGEKHKSKAKLIIPVILLVGALALGARGCGKSDEKTPPPDSTTTIEQVDEDKYVERVIIENIHEVDEYMATDNAGQTLYDRSQAIGQEELIGELRGLDTYSGEEQARREAQAIDLYGQINAIDDRVAQAFEDLQNGTITTQEYVSIMQECTSQKLEIQRDNRDLLLSYEIEFANASEATRDDTTLTEEEIAQAVTEKYDQNTSVLEANQEMFDRLGQYLEQGYDIDITFSERPNGDVFITYDGTRETTVLVDKATGEVIEQSVDGPQQSNDGQEINDD